MRTLQFRNLICALAGLASLAICILACTSFSPDDKQVLYPSFDPQSGTLAISLLDRPSGASRQVFVLGSRSVPPDKDKGFLVPRAQWLPDGKRVVVTWSFEPETKDETGIASFALISLDGREPVRVLHLEADKEAVPLYLRPIPMIGERVYLVAKSNLLGLDLVSGRLESRPLQEQLVLLMVPMTNRLGYVEGLEDESSASGDMEFGLLDPNTMAREWRLRVPRTNLLSVAFSPSSRKVAFVPEPKESEPPRMVLLEEGKSPRDLLLPVTETESLELGYCAFSPKGDVLFASFTLQTNGGPATAFGFVEVPLDGSTPRRTLLIQNASISDSDKRNANTFFEFGLSHDGKTLAVSSTGVALVSPEMKTEDCALFLVDLSQPSRKVTKVAIPLPANHVAIVE